MDRDRIIEKLNGTTVNLDGFPYKLARELGRGGNGVAFLCRSPGKDEVVAKIYIPPDTRDLDNRALERFRNEIAITTKIKHSYVIPALGASTIAVGAYQLPLYMMPVAAGTLRREVQPGLDPDAIERKLRLLLRALLGTACLHHHGIVHRDLKPENILINKAGNPWVADLGIAHVAPDFVSVGLKTMASERLLNRDYYAPEQRFGAATQVDGRVDIYALGCIMYELITSIPPVRAHAPALKTLSPALAPLDSVWKRMTEWEPDRRYQTLEEVTEDLSMAMGLVLATLRGAAGLRNPDLATMIKLLRSNNDLQKQQGIELAVRLGKAALNDLHVLLGHGRRDVRNAVAKALGQIADPSSVPALVAGLYGSADKASRFRPSTDAAADALSRYPEDERLRAIRLVERPIRPDQIVSILRGLPTAGYEAAILLKERKLILVDWAETDLMVFVAIDEDRAWPEVQDYIEQGDDFRKRYLIAHLSAEKRREVLRRWVEKGTEYRWYLSDLIKWIIDAEFTPTEIESLFERLEKDVQASRIPADDQAKMLQRLQKAKASKRSVSPDGLT